jgi:hypothetical protein
VEGRFRDGITAGEIPSDFPVAVRAIQVTDFARGLTMRAQLGTPRKTLLRDAEEAADLVLQSRSDRTKLELFVRGLDGLSRFFAKEQAFRNGK